jgi:hypothetical protein
MQLSNLKIIEIGRLVIAKDYEIRTQIFFKGFLSLFLRVCHLRQESA